MTVLSTTTLLCIILCQSLVTLTKDGEKLENPTKNITVGVNGIIHEGELLMFGVNRPYQLSYYSRNKSEHILYFSYNIGLHNESTFEIGYSENGYPVPKPIKEVKNGFATALNHKEHVIYFGGSEGIYVHHIKSTSPNHTHHLVHGHDIWDMFYHDGLYFITFPKRRLYKLHHDNTFKLQEHIHEKIYNFVIDGDGDMFMNNKTGLFMIKNDSEKSYKRIHMKGPKVFRAFEVNRKGVAHFCGQNAVYVADKEKHKLHEIAKIENIFGLTFDDNNHMIYSDSHQVVKLKQEKNETQKASK